MSNNYTKLVQHTFSQAIIQGNVSVPHALTVLISDIEAKGYVDQISVKELNEIIDLELPFIDKFSQNLVEPKSEEFENWIQVTRWIIKEIISLDISKEGSNSVFRLLIASLKLMDVDKDGLSIVSEFFNKTHVPKSIAKVLKELTHIPNIGSNESNEWIEEILRLSKLGEFQMLKQGIRAFEIPYQIDIYTCIYLLWKIDHHQLEALIKEKNSIIFEMLVCNALDSDAPLFALQSDCATLKFISLSWIPRMHLKYPEIKASDVIEKFLMQISMTPYWKSWIKAVYGYPQQGDEKSRALAIALTKLGESQWREFIIALNLTTVQGSAAGVADILVQVMHILGSERMQPFWSTAFDRWEGWDYGRDAESQHLLSPMSCSFDFPVSMYYSQLPCEQLELLEKTLQNAILHIEQSWFASEIEVASERNRLASKLRLVRHGSALAAGGKEALPPKIQPDSDYAKVRYGFHDVNALPTSRKYN